MPRCSKSDVVKTKGKDVIFHTQYETTWPVSDIENESLVTHEMNNPKQFTMMWNAFKSNLSKKLWLLGAAKSRRASDACYLRNEFWYKLDAPCVS